MALACPEHAWRAVHEHADATVPARNAVLVQRDAVTAGVVVDGWICESAGASGHPSMIGSGVSREEKGVKVAVACSQIYRFDFRLGVVGAGVVGQLKGMTANGRDARLNVSNTC